MSNVQLTEAVDALDESIAQMAKQYKDETRPYGGDPIRADRLMTHMERVTTARQQLMLAQSYDATVEQVMELEAKVDHLYSMTSGVGTNDPSDSLVEPTANETVAAIEAERETGGSFEPDTIDE